MAEAVPGGGIGVSEGADHPAFPSLDQIDSAGILSAGILARGGHDEVVAQRYGRMAERIARLRGRILDSMGYLVGLGRPCPGSQAEIKDRRKDEEQAERTRGCRLKR